MGKPTDQTRFAASAANLTAQQLTEFLSAVSSFTEERDLLRSGVEHLAEAIGADAAAIVRDGRVEASTGFFAGSAPVAEANEVATEPTFERELGGLGLCSGISCPVGDDGTRLLAARSGADGFTEDAMGLLGGVARVLALSLRSIRLIDELQERQKLLERLTTLQRSIASRDDLDEVFDAIVTGASELLGDEVVDLSLIDPEEPSTLEIVASVGFSDEILEQIRRTPVNQGTAGHAITERRPIVVEDYESDPRHMPGMALDGLRSVISAPVYQRGELVGALSLGTRRRGRRYREMERDAVLAFAEHAGLALNDAKAAEETAHQAFHDPLTGLANRALFLDRLGQARARAASTGGSVGVLFADLDGFKTVNDSLGHAAGDQLLIIAAQRLVSVAGPTDTVARFGGDEFAILIENANEPITAARLARRALETLERVIEIHGREVFVTASIGVAAGLEEPEELMRRADLAMYEAKGRGKGRYELFQSHMHEAMTERLDLELELRGAAERGEFVLHYQPIIELASGRVVGVEALLRWMHPTRGLITPDQFIPIAEEGGQIHALGRWVLREACERIVEWESEHGSLHLTVNLSSAQLRQASLVREVREVLAFTGLDPSRLTLEITETVLMDVSTSNLERLAALKRAGVRLAVDDFGTGYSSLQYLRRFPIDWLKMAKFFVDGVERAGSSSRLARAIVNLAHSLDIEVIAEGIESSAQSAVLADLGCLWGQGFYYSPPLPAAEISEQLRSRAVAP